MIKATTGKLIELFQEAIRGAYPKIFDGLSPEDLEEEMEKRVLLSAGGITQLAKLPAVIFNGPMLIEKHRLNRDTERITYVDEEKAIAVREVSPRWYDLKFDLNIACEGGNPELLELIGTFSRLNQSSYLLTANNGEHECQYVWRYETPPQISTNPNISEVSQGRASIIVYDVEAYSGIRETWPLIQTVSAEIEKDRIEVNSDERSSNQKLMRWSS